MTPKRDSEGSIIDKKFFTVRNCVSLVLLAIGCTSAWGVMTSRVSENKTELSSHSVINKSHVLNFIKLDAKIDASNTAHSDDLDDLSKELEAGIKEVRTYTEKANDEMREEIARTSYNNSQLTYRLNSGQTKLYTELKDLVHKGALNSVKVGAKMDYIIIMLENQKDGEK